MSLLSATTTTIWEEKDMSIFLTWFDAMCDKAKASPVGQILTARGFDIAHTGGRFLGKKDAVALLPDYRPRR